MTALTAHPTERLTGTALVPGDKSISHRALMIAGLAVGESRISGLLDGEDVLRTAAAMRALGCRVAAGSGETPVWSVRGRGLGGLTAPADVLDMGNSGTAARLLLGILASHPLTVVMTGDASLRGRPMGRVTEPLAACGARFLARDGGRLPITVTGSGAALPLDYRLPVASAQVKSALLLAGLNARGETRVAEPVATRDHSERMLRHFGATLGVAPLEGSPGGRLISLTGQPELEARDIVVPRDPSSAAFPLVAALLLPGSELHLPGVGINPARTGLLQCLKEMGADLALENRREEGGEPVADLVARGGPLKGITVPASRAASMIDEYPILAVAAAVAEGTTRMEGLGELRVKESDRLALMARGLAAAGLEVAEGADSLVVVGRGGRPRGGVRIESALDHRIAMSFLVLGLTAEQPVTIDDGAPIATSFPDFLPLMRGLGADFQAGIHQGEPAPQ